MKKQSLSRRSFLKKGTITAASAVALALSGISISPSAWAMTLTTIDNTTGKSLSAFCRTLYPHSQLTDVYYDACVESLDAKAKNDPALLKLLNDGVKTLNSHSQHNFLALSAEQQLVVVKQIEGSPFFDQVRSHIVVALYNNDKIWNLFGYEGPSFPYGGYLERGFNDIDWLPNH
jgi:hypothetical protein